MKPIVIDLAWYYTTIGENNEILPLHNRHNAYPLIATPVDVYNGMNLEALKNLKKFIQINKKYKKKKKKKFFSSPLQKRTKS